MGQRAIVVYTIGVHNTRPPMSHIHNPPELPPVLTYMHIQRSFVGDSQVMVDSQIIHTLVI